MLIAANKAVSIDYTLTNDAGEVIDSSAGGAPLVYLQFGDGPATYANPNVRQMLAQALDYTSGGTA